MYKNIMAKKRLLMINANFLVFKISKILEIKHFELKIIHTN